AEPELALIARNGERTLHKIFRGIHSVLGPSLMGGAIILVLIVTNLAIPAVSLGNSSTGFFAELLNFAANIVIAFELGSFLWVYLTSLRGLHQLGREGLRLMPSREDPTLGLRRLGSISLSLAFAYFAFVAVGAFTF